jgi:hypothetical protein
MTLPFAYLWFFLTRSKAASEFISETLIRRMCAVEG